MITQTRNEIPVTVKITAIVDTTLGEADVPGVGRLRLGKEGETLRVFIDNEVVLEAVDKEVP